MCISIMEFGARRLLADLCLGDDTSSPFLSNDVDFEDNEALHRKETPEPDYKATGFIPSLASLCLDPSERPNFDDAIEACDGGREPHDCRDAGCFSSSPPPTFVKGPPKTSVIPFVIRQWVIKQARDAQASNLYAFSFETLPPDKEESSKPWLPDTSFWKHQRYNRQRYAFSPLDSVPWGRGARSTYGKLPPLDASERKKVQKRSTILGPVASKKSSFVRAPTAQRKKKDLKKKFNDEKKKR